MRGRYRSVMAWMWWMVLAGGVAASDLPRNWPMAPSELDHRLAYDDFEIRTVHSAGGGVTGASKLTVAFPDGQTLDIKWKVMPRGSLDGWNNSPRKEVAAYAIQRWLFDEDDYIVPTPVPRCIALERYRPIDAHASPTVRGTRCVLGIAVVWMRDVEPPDEIYDAARFRADAHYAQHMADFNLLTYLIDHRDGRRGNFLISTDPTDPRMFAVDNGIAFGPFMWNFFVRNWNTIRVPWLRRLPVDRLRTLDRAELERRLGALVELHVDPQGVMQLVRPPGPNMKPAKGVRIAADRIQLGLTAGEIGDVEERIDDLLRDVDAGKVRVE